jgi:hypothetical protein
VRELSCGRQGPQPPRPLGSAELSQRLSLDLPDPLARDIELLADHILHPARIILDVMYAKAPYTVIQRAVHIHPTVSELIPTMLGDLQPLAG